MSKSISFDVCVGHNVKAKDVSVDGVIALTVFNGTPIAVIGHRSDSKKQIVLRHKKQEAIARGELCGGYSFFALCPYDAVFTHSVIKRNAFKIDALQHITDVHRKVGRG